MAPLVSGATSVSLTYLLFDFFSGRRTQTVSAGSGLSRANRRGSRQGGNRSDDSLPDDDDET